LAGVLVLTALGCRQRPAAVSRPAPRWAGVTVRVAAPDGPARLLLSRHGAVWANATGAKLAVGDAAADLLLLPPAGLPHWAAAGKLRPLPPEAVDGVLTLYRTRLLHWEGVPYGLPILGDGPICVYRLDAYRDPESKRAFREKHQYDLNPPATWDEFADQAAFFAERRGKPSLPPLPADDAGLTRAFYALAAPLAVRSATGGAGKSEPGHGRSARLFSFHYDVDSGEPRIDRPGFVEALKLLRALQPHCSRQPSATAALAAGEAVLGYVTLADLAGLGSDAVRWGVFRQPGSRRVFDADRPAPLLGGEPNHVPYVGAGGMVGVVPQSAAQPDAALDLLAYLASEPVSLEVVHTPEFGSGPFRELHLTRNTQGWRNYGLEEHQTTLLRQDLMREVADPRLDNPAVVLRIPEAHSHEQALAAALRQALAGDGDSAAALVAVAQRWRELDGDLARARAAYRRSLGLPP
jgi:ABC-type glycerol-3-phosphate transport system substrate-binding protein